jgi:hypothetical protein
VFSILLLRVVAVLLFIIQAAAVLGAIVQAFQVISQAPIHHLSQH